MTGRGSSKLIHTSDNPFVVVGLTLGTSSPTLSQTSSDPFYVTVTARLLKTPHPDRPVTLQKDPSPLGGLDNRSFSNIACASGPQKHIEIFPRGWPHNVWDTLNLRKSWFATIPPPGQGSLTVSHEVRRDRIAEAGVQKGERYKVSLTNMCLGTRWWTFQSLEELEGVRLKAWEGDAERDIDEEDPEYAEERKRAELEKFGTGPATMGEEPEMLAMVMEGSGAEFEIA